METISIINRRGGVGKTATAHALGAGLSFKGHKVLYVDLDSQTNLSYDLGAEAGAGDSMELLRGSCTAREAVTTCNIENCSVITASPELSIADVILTSMGKEYRLKEALEPINNDYDYCVIDTPPALGVLLTNALTASNRIIIPAQAEIHSLQGIGQIAEIVTQAKKYTNPGLKIDGILITRWNGRAILSKDMQATLEETAAALHTKVYREPIRECIAIKEAQAMQQDIFTYSPRSNAAKDYESFILEVLGGGQ